LTTKIFVVFETAFFSQVAAEVLVVRTLKSGEFKDYYEKQHATR
jgi:hypothetical protein